MLEGAFYYSCTHTSLAYIFIYLQRFLYTLMTIFRRPTRIFTPRQFIILVTLNCYTTSSRWPSSVTSQRLVQTTSINTKIAGIWSSIFYYYETGAYSNWFHKLNCILIRLDQPEQIYYHWLQYRCICCCAEELARIDVDSADTRAPMCGSGGGGLPIMLQRTLDINCPLPVWWWYAPSSRGGGGSIGRPQLGCWWGSPISPCPPGIVIWFTLWLRSSGIGRGGS